MPALTCIDIGVGWHEAGVPTIAAMRAPRRVVVCRKRIKDAVSVPVIASNRINTPETAEQLLAAGTATTSSRSRGRSWLTRPSLPR